MFMNEEQVTSMHEIYVSLSINTFSCISAPGEDIREEGNRVNVFGFASRVYIALLGQLAADLTSWQHAKQPAALHRVTSASTTNSRPGSESNIMCLLFQAHEKLIYEYTP